VDAFRRSSSYSLVFTIAAAASLCAACSTQRARTRATLTDDWGRAVAADSPARRIVSLSPTTTEVSFALGLGDRLVGRTTWCDWPEAARAVADVGNGIGPNVEAIAARRPDLVLLYASDANRQALARLEAVGIRAFVLKLDLAADVRRAARAIATLAGRDRAGDSLVVAFDSALAQASRAAARIERRPPRVYVDVEANPPITVGAGSYLTEILAAAGARNAFADIAAPSGTVSLEAIARRDPDVVLVLAADTARRHDLARRPGWRAVRAVRDGRIVVVDGSLYGRPSPRMPEAVRDLAARLAAAVPPRPSRGGS
jgi:iron complex transport system substrate-binding protein